TQGLRRALQINPHGVAILEGERQIEWAELGGRVSRFAGALRKNGVGKCDRVALLMLNSSRYLELYLAVGWAGAAKYSLERPRESSRNRRLWRSSSYSRRYVQGSWKDIDHSHSRTCPGLRWRGRSSCGYRII